MMFRCSILIFSVLLTFQWNFAEANTRPYLWKVKGKKPSYILGTIHSSSLKKDLAPVVMKVFEKAEMVYLEADTEAVWKSPKIAEKLMRLPPSKSLRHYVNDEAWGKLRALLPAVPEAALQGRQPWVVSSMVITRLIPQTGKGMDLHFKKLADESKKKTEFLELWQEQMFVLNTLNIDYMGRNVEKMLLQPKQVQKEYSEMLRAYRIGSDKLLAKIIESQCAEVPGMFKTLFTSRNKGWAKKLQKSLRKGNLFVAVGAGHLVGKGNLIEILRANGHKITRCKLRSCP